VRWMVVDVRQGPEPCGDVAGTSRLPPRLAGRCALPLGTPRLYANRSMASCRAWRRPRPAGVGRCRAARACTRGR
jgi:hypothetical protein